MNITQIQTNVLRSVGVLALLLTSHAAHAANDLVVPAHRVQTAGVTGEGSITITSASSSRSYRAIIYGDVTYQLTLTSGEPLTVTLKNGDASAVFKGKPIAQSRVLLKSNHLRVLDDAGNALFRAILAPGVRPAKPRLMLGVSVGMPDEALIAQLDINPDTAVLTQVFSDTPAADAGLEPYDILLRLDGQRVTQLSLSSIISEKKPGDVVSLEVLRKGAPIRLVATLKLVADSAAANEPQTFNFQQRTNQSSLLTDSLKSRRFAEQQLQDLFNAGATLQPSWQRFTFPDSALDSLREQVNTLHKRMEKIRKNATLGSERKKEMLNTSLEAMNAVETAIESYNLKLDFTNQDMPHIKFFNTNQNESGKDDDGVILFNPAIAPSADGPGSQIATYERRSLTRLNFLEERLERIEALLKSLIVQQQKKITTPKSASTNETPAGT